MKEKKILTSCERIIALSEQIYFHKLGINKAKSLKFFYSRLNSPPPSIKELSTIVEESRLRIEEMQNSIKKIITPLLRGIKFDITPYLTSSKEFYRGYIELYNPLGSKYYLFLKSFKNKNINIEEGSLLEDTKELSSFISTIPKIKRTNEYLTIFEILKNQKNG